MQERLFRKKALERLSSPEELDQLMRVTSPRSWLALFGVFLLIVLAVVWGFFGSVPTTVAGEGILLRGRIDTVTSPASGLLEDIYVNVGDTVEQGQVISRLLLGSLTDTASQDALRENLRIESPSTGRVIELRVSPGSFVNVGDPLINLEPTGDDIKDLEAILYLPANEGKKVRPGMKVLLEPSTVRAEETGVVLGWVTSVGDFPESQQSMLRVLENVELVNRFFNATSEALLEIRVDLIPSRDTVSGYRWSSPDGANIEIQSGTLFEAIIILEEKSPIQLIFPFLGRL
jgi:hypothetical protein